jgi:hypothetical protein
MATHRKSGSSLTSTVWGLIEKNPLLAAEIAFQLGAMAGHAVHGSTAARLRKSGSRAVRSLGKSLQGVPEDLSKSLPVMRDLGKLAGLKLLTGPSPKLAPLKRGATKRSPKPRKTA